MFGHTLITVVQSLQKITFYKTVCKIAILEENLNVISILSEKQTMNRSNVITRHFLVYPFTFSIFQIPKHYSEHVSAVSAVCGCVNTYCCSPLHQECRIMAKVNALFSTVLLKSILCCRMKYATSQKSDKCLKWRTVHLAHSSYYCKVRHSF